MILFMIIILIIINIFHSFGPNLKVVLFFNIQRNLSIYTRGVQTETAERANFCKACKGTSGRNSRSAVNQHYFHYARIAKCC